MVCTMCRAPRCVFVRPYHRLRARFENGPVTQRRGYGLSDQQLERLFRSELVLVPESAPGEPADSWQADFEGHQVRVLAAVEQGFELIVDGEPLGDFEPLPPGWRIAGFA